MADSGDITLEMIEAEIVAVHDFIAVWFRGEADRSSFDRTLRRRLAPDMINIQPSGEVLSASTLLAGLKHGFGANPDFRIEISDVAILRTIDSPAGAVVLAIYTEHQFGARNTDPPDNDRRSTVMLRRAHDADGFEWLHIHETGLTKA
ncbi:DUF4440 domain-containing protein [Parasphingopyxis algicola]|uniref:DUF4440 domain-containing protein n=1 Tax=Parasphingopyxis algicola TaxID=2026624 RepID=UPI0015A2F491|nr:DUF4440 domain-containing protein [Parasphingopyxis algicola]QLC25590.1 DUF4440 domain-containing protein [Parasphingopyxis algicola]